MKVKVIATGEREVAESLRRMGKAGTDAAKPVFKRLTEKILAKSRPLVPVDVGEPGAGDLRDSGRTTRPTATKAGISAGVVYGGDPLESATSNVGHRLNLYAIVQHEDTTLRHDHGQAKFLEQPFFEVAQELPAEMIAALDAVASQEGAG